MWWIPLLRYWYHILHQGTLILNSWRAQLDMMWNLNLWICIEIFLLVYWDLGLFAFLKDCEHICILEDDLSFKLGFVRIAWMFIILLICHQKILLQLEIWNCTETNNFSYWPCNHLRTQYMLVKYSFKLFNTIHTI